MVRQALADFECPISAEELAGFALEEHIQSRLVIEENGQWDVEHGPFSEDTFQDLPESGWSLLVQGVDHFIPEIAVLLEQFDFIPAWRIDDIMISFAPDGGSVGPHIDNYDVFLIQGTGKRQWSINENRSAKNQKASGKSEHNVIDNFTATSEWLLEAGDMLYLPPGIAHHGVASGPGMTISIGFRAPLQSELWDAFLYRRHQDGKDSFFSDPELELQQSRGEILNSSIDAIRQHMQSAVLDEQYFRQWFGQHITENPPYELLDREPQVEQDDFLIQFKQSGECYRPGFVRMFFVENESNISLYFSGQEYHYAKSLQPVIRYLCDHYIISYIDFIDIAADEEAEAISLIASLFNHGCYYFNHDE